MSTLTGVPLLARQQLRRDRVLASVWLLVVALVCYASAAATPGLYATTAEQVRAAQQINASPGIVALYGPIADVHSLGELAMTKMTVLYAVLVSVLVVVLVRRHTRVEEESGRAELVGGTGVGRDAPLAAAVVGSVVVAVALGLLVALVNVVGGLPAVGSVAFGAMYTGTALVAAGIAAVACQLAASARTCAAYAAGALGACYLLRALADTSASWLGWLSPYGWNTRVQAYSDPRWWVLGLYVVAAAGLVAVAVALRARRDLGAGLVAARPGPAHGSPRLADAPSLCVRVHTTSLVLWTVALGVAGLLFGFILPGMDSLLDSATARRLVDDLGGELVSAVLSVVAVVVSCFGVAVVVHAGSDESDGRVELVLATGTSRTRWLAASLVVALVGQAWLLLVTGVTLWSGYAVAGGPHANDVLGAALAWVPATWVVTGLAAVMLAIDGRWAVGAWVWPALFLTLTLVGDLLSLPAWLTGLSPYAHVPAIPAEPFEVGPEAGLVVVTAVALLAAWMHFTRRDIG